MKKIVSLILSVLILCSVFVGTGAIANAAYEPVEVTLVSQQNSFESITKTYAKGEVFELTVMWQSNNPLRNIELYTYLNNQGLKVISEDVNKTKISSNVLTNITEALQQKYGEVIFSFSIVKGCDFTTADYLVTYQVEVLDTASAQETLTLNCREAFGTNSDNLAEDICYVADSAINEENKDSFAISAVLSEPAEVPTEPTTESTVPSESSSETESSSVTESSSATESSSVTESSSDTVDTTATEPSSDTTDTTATDPSESTSNTDDSTATEPGSDNTDPTNPDESTVPSESTEPTEAHTHQWDNGTVITPATCTESGEIKYLCTECGAFKITVLDATGHTGMTVNAKKATYFAKGYTGDTICEDCGELLESGTAVKKLKLTKPTVSYKAGKGKFTVNYTKVKKAKGFEVKYKIGKKTFNKTFKAKKSVSKVIKNLKKGTYKVQVRAYKTKGNKTAYSKWTKKTKVKVK